MLRFIKEYANRERTFRSNNCKKYYFFCIVLDSLILIKEQDCNKTLTIEGVLQCVDLWGTYGLNGFTSIGTLRSWLKDMERVGLIKIRTPYVYLTIEGEHAYKNQSYHMFAATIYESKRNRELAYYAFLIALLSFSLSIVGIIFC